jgi:hypothetical protein
LFGEKTGWVFSSVLNFYPIAMRSFAITLWLKKVKNRPLKFGAYNKAEVDLIFIRGKK